MDGRSMRLAVLALLAVGTVVVTGTAASAADELQLVKLTNGTDNSAAPGPIVPVGSSVTFTYALTNSGNISLSNVSLIDDNGTPGNAADDFSPTFVSGDAGIMGVLDLGETWMYT